MQSFIDTGNVLVVGTPRHIMMGLSFLIKKENGSNKLIFYSRDEKEHSQLSYITYPPGIFLSCENF